MDVKGLYQDQIKQVIELNLSIRNSLYVAFPLPNAADIGDLHDIRMLVDKLHEAKVYTDELIRTKNLRVRPKQKRPVP